MESNQHLNQQQPANPVALTYGRIDDERPVDAFNLNRLR